MSFLQYYTPSVQRKYFNVLIDGKRFFNTPIKYKEEAYEKTLTWEEIMTKQQVICWILIFITGH